MIQFKEEEKKCLKRKFTIIFFSHILFFWSNEKENLRMTLFKCEQTHKSNKTKRVSINWSVIVYRFVVNLNFEKNAIYSITHYK